MDLHSVELYIYDLSCGEAKKFASENTTGVWQTSIKVYNKEFYFGSKGISVCNPNWDVLSIAKITKYLGETNIEEKLFVETLKSLSLNQYRAETYNLFNYNSNQFAEQIVRYLCGATIPEYVFTSRPRNLLGLPYADIVERKLQQYEDCTTPVLSLNQCKEKSPEFEQLQSQIEEARYNSFLLAQRRKTLSDKLAKKERKREKKRKKILASGGVLPPELREDFTMADTESMESVNGQPQLPSDQALELEEEERRAEEAKKKSREPPIVYKDIVDVKNEFDNLVALIDGKLTLEEQQATEELQQYMIGDEGSWALSDGFLDFVGRLLNDTQFSVDVRVKTFNILAAAALKDDVILVLHQDRKDHVLMNYAFEIDRLSIEEQEAIALFMANMFENLSSSEWLLYISEWTYNNQQTSNIRVTTKVAVHSLLSDSPVLQDRGSAIIHNLACKEVKTVVFDDVAVELTMALLQYFNSKPPEEKLYRCMKALAKFVQVSTQEVPQLIQLIGPDPRDFKGISERIDNLIEQITAKLR